MGQDIIVQYNGTVLSPTPLVQQNYSFIDYGARWGNVVEISLDGYITGINSGNFLSVQQNFSSYFTGQFGALDVLEGATPMYQWRNVIVEDIVLAPNKLFQTSITPYSVKMKSYAVPSGVTEPQNEYSFSQGEDGIVSVTHKISARGIRTEGVGALTNAKNFCSNFIGSNPFANAFGTLNGPNFVPYGSGILASTVETIDRATATYSFTETYKYNTGAAQPYVETFAITTSDIMDNEWLTVDVDWHIQGSPITDNLNVVEPMLGKPITKISSLGYTTGNLIQSSMNITRNTGAATVDIKASYVSGYNATDIAGYFDYTVTLDFDGTQPREDWRIDGDFVCFGPRDYRYNQLVAFKHANGTNWRAYLSGLVVNSPIFSQHDPTRTWGSQSEFSITENTGLATLHLSLTAPDGARTVNLLNPKYNVEIQPNKWVYDMLPAANIEGHYVLQDLQVMSQSKMNFSIASDTKNTNGGLVEASGALDTLASKYATSGFQIARSYYTGWSDVSTQSEWLGVDATSSGLLYTKMAGSTLSNFVRQPGYKFGY